MLYESEPESWITFLRLRSYRLPPSCTLSGIGAQHFFVSNLYGGNSSTQSFNVRLHQDMTTLDTAGLAVTLFDARSVFLSMTASGNQWGFTHTSFSDPCLLGDHLGGGGTVCSDPGKYVVYDNMGHLTAAAGVVMGSAMVSAAAVPVPEPESYAMMLAGLGLMGFMARRRKQKAA